MSAPVLTPASAPEWPINPFDDEQSQQQGSTLQFAQKVVTQPPLATSLPTTPLIPRFSVYTDDESAPLLAQVSSHIDETQDLGSYTLPEASPSRRPKVQRSRSIISFDLKSLNERVSQFTNSIARWTSNTQPPEDLPNEIQYSVFKPPPGIVPITKIPPNGYIYTGPVNKHHFDMIVEDACNAIENGVSPKRIAAGSSGSYFIYTTTGEIVGVFKPKDEEPYGPLSPKWTKWLHRNLFPCFFGRSCLIPNLGYVCESAASLLDKHIQTHIVPYTDIVEISSESFYYSYWERRSARRHNRPLRAKLGSFQLFLKGYEEADKFFLKYPLPGSKWGFPQLYGGNRNDDDNVPVGQNDDANGNPEFKWTSETLLEFREELEKLVILDYIMRNTDRGLDNWMIRLDWVKQANGSKKPRLKIGAIDSGLSWPWKHPDEWRSYPFGWLFLPASIIGQPFTEKTRRHFLPLLTSTVWWEECTVLFRAMFARDEDFKERMWKKQWAVMKGQAFNVVETLKNPTQGPLELARRTRVMVWDEVMEVPVHVPTAVMTNAIETPISPAKRVWAKDRMQSISTPLDAIIEDERGRNDDDDNNGDDNENEDHDEGALEAVEANDIPINMTSADTMGTIEAQADTGLTFAQDSMATKKVIIERLQQVNSKPAVFTWC